MFSLTGYYGIIDFGVRSSIVKYVAEFEAKSDREGLSNVVNASILIYICISLILLIVIGISSLFLSSIFHITPNFLNTARVLFLMVGVAVALGFPLSVFSGVLEGLQMSYVVNLTQAVGTCVRGLLIVVALNHGMGLLTIAFVTVTIPLLSYVIYAWRVQRVVPLQLGLRFFDRATIMKMFKYSFYCFVSSLAFQLRFQTDAVIIGAMLSTSAITHFSLGSKLVNYSSLFVAGLAQIFTPMSSQFDATGDHGRLRKLFLLGNRACAFTVFPINAMLLVLGRSIIRIWVGPRYESSYVILAILVIPTILSDIQGTSRQILYGMGRHKALALVNVIEGVVNVVLSVVLIHYWGIFGDALGTAIPLTITSVFFLPPFLCRLLKVQMRDFLTQSYFLPLVLCGPMIAVLLFMEHSFPAHTYLQLSAQAAAGVFVYGVGVVWFFLTRESMGIELRRKFREHVLLAISR